LVRVECHFANWRRKQGKTPLTRILILGANGQIAHVATYSFLKHTDVELTLYVRDTKRLKPLTSLHGRVVQGDVLDAKAL